jgi:anthraniloyl-CoA monooxygenase
MRLSVIGGGPGGLFFAALAKRLLPGAEVVLWERGEPGDGSGFGVVFSDGALGGVAAADPELFSALAAEFVGWSEIGVRHRGVTTTSPGHEFVAVSRSALLRLLGERCRELGVDVRTGAAAPPVEQLQRESAVVVAADGARSAVRERYRAEFGSEVAVRGSRYIWLATDRPFEGLTFAVQETAAGPLHAHAYPFAPGRSTFIVETDARTWHAAGFAELPEPAPGEGDAAAVERLTGLFADVLDGHGLHGDRSRWSRFRAVRNRRWTRGNLALLGDAAHTTHFSVGSGTKLAMEDALALALAVAGPGTVPEALAAYAAERREAVARLQRVAEASEDWFERIADSLDREPPAFTVDLLTRGGRLDRDDLPVQDEDALRRVRSAFASAATVG